MEKGQFNENGGLGTYDYSKFSEIEPRMSQQFGLST